MHLYFPANLTADGQRALMLVGDDWSTLDDVKEKSGRFGVWRRCERVAFAGAPTISAAQPGKLHSDRILPVLGLSSEEWQELGVWFRLRREPVPHGTLGAMLDEISSAAGEQPNWALDQLRGILGSRLRGDTPPLVIALGYPAGTGERQWLFLRAEFPGVHRKLNWASPAYLQQIKLQSYETAPAGREALMRRTGHIAAALGARRVLIFGQGAIGSTISMLLAQSGVPNLHLVDRDHLRPGNVVRHVGSLHHAGMRKTHAMELEIVAHVPDCEVTTSKASSNPAILAQWVSSADVVVDATASSVFSRLLNEVCLQVGKPAVYVAAYRRAAVGRVRLVRPGQDACLTCYEGAGGYVDFDGYPLIPHGDEGAYLEGGCGVPTVQPSAVDVAEAATWAARSVLWLLQEKVGDRNHCLVVCEPLPDATGVLAQVGVHWSRWQPVSGCHKLRSTTGRQPGCVGLAVVSASCCIWRVADGRPPRHTSPAADPPLFAPGE